jgi:hydroxymethylglutaryl-CoA reductase
LSNLADRSLVTASVKYALEALATNQLSGEQVRDRIVKASEIAIADPYRAATHNKGAMNGIDAVALATGNDWRAIEAGAHAYAAASGRYRPLATWRVADDGSLQGELRMPLRVATVGGTLQANKAAALALRLIGTESSRELAKLMAAVGLAQNFAAIKALVTDGIQEGHMRMHARSAKSQQQTARELHEKPDGHAAGKVILLGEHAVVYGKHALALPIAAAVTAKFVQPGIEVADFVRRLQDFVRQQLGIEDDTTAIDIRTKLPPGMGLGVSAAMAVAVVRAFNSKYSLQMDDSAVNALAFECEKLAHGSPSGIDNTVATHAVPMLFRKSGDLELRDLDVSLPPAVIAYSSKPGSTLQQVAGVRARQQLQAQHYEAVFATMDGLALAAADALCDEDYRQLGMLMNTAHGLLNAIGVSTPELESMVAMARAAGATGAKLTGGGGGGSIVAMCPGTTEAVVAALDAAGYETLSLADWKET